jgi:hypothetical protein
MATNRKLYKDAVSTFGHGPQIDVAVREAASLIGEIQEHKLMRPCDIQRAIADMEIICSQLRLIFPGVPDVKKKRLERLQELIDGRKVGTIS